MPLSDAEAFRAEQAYHRARVAKVVNHLHGSGTVAGLNVSHDPDAGHLVVAPGLAIDRVGRMVELSEAATVDLAGWLARSGQPTNGSQVCVDVHVRFDTQRDCSPSGESSVLEEVEVTGRLLESAQILLTARGDSPDSLPPQRWWVIGPDEDGAAWQRRVQDHLLNQDWLNGEPGPDAASEGVADPTAVFLARVTIDTSVAEGLSTSGSRTVRVDNHSRSFVYPNAVLVGWLQALTAAVVQTGR